MREIVRLMSKICALASCVLYLVLLWHYEKDNFADPSQLLIPSSTVDKPRLLHGVAVLDTPVAAGSHAPSLEGARAQCILPRGLSRVVQRSVIQDMVYRAMDGDDEQIIRSRDKVCTRPSIEQCPDCSYCPWEPRDQNVVLTLGYSENKSRDTLVPWLPAGTETISLDDVFNHGVVSSVHDWAPVLNITKYSVRLALLEGPYKDVMLQALIGSEVGWIPEQIIVHGTTSPSLSFSPAMFRRSGLVPVTPPSLASKHESVEEQIYMHVCEWTNLTDALEDRWSEHELRRLKEDGEHSINITRYPDTACSAFAIVSINNLAGLGHRVWDIVLGIMFSMSTGTPFRLDVNRLEGTGDHGRYNFLVSAGFLPLDEVFITRREIRKFFPGSDSNIKIDDGKFQDAVFRHENVTLECNKTTRFYSDYLCDGGWCFMDKFHDKTDDPHQLTRPFFMQAMQRSRFFALRDLRPPSTLVIVWHIRTKDISLGNGTTFQTNIAGTLTSALEGIRSIIYITAEEKTGPIQKALDCCRLQKLNCQLLIEDAPTTLHAMINADVLIHCGSSFSHVAALCSQSTLHLIPREKENPSKELPTFLIGSYRLNDDGTLHEPVERLRADLVEKNKDRAQE